MINLNDFNKRTGLNVSKKYSVINTTDLLAAFESQGYEVSTVKQARVRSIDRQGFQKHEIRLRHNSLKIGIDGLVPEIIVQNSYNGTAAFKVIMGVFRFACSNGLIVGTAYENLKVKHVGDVMPKVLIACENIRQQTERMQAEILAMQARVLTVDEMLALAKTVSKVLLPDVDSANVRYSDLIRLQRVEDASTDLFTVLNRIQENALKGGLSYITAKEGVQRWQSTRTIKSIDRTTEVNQLVWNAATDLLAA